MERRREYSRHEAWMREKERETGREKRKRERGEGEEGERKAGRVGLAQAHGLYAQMVT